jgi:hypothetical protein
LALRASPRAERDEDAAGLTSLRRCDVQDCRAGVPRKLDLGINVIIVFIIIIMIEL